MRGADGRAARDLQQFRSELAHPGAELTLECADIFRDVAAAPEHIERDSTTSGLRQGDQGDFETLQPHVAVEHTRRQHQSDLKIVAVPTQALLDAFALAGQVVAMIDEQPNVCSGPARDASGRPRSRSAALATQAAAIGSDLP